MYVHFNFCLSRPCLVRDKNHPAKMSCLEKGLINCAAVIDGRFCSTALGPSCCLPCPATDWLYPDNFRTMTTAANWVNVGSIIFAVFMLVSWAVLPPSKSGRHYLSICLTIAIIFMSVSILIYQSNSRLTYLLDGFHRTTWC